VAVLGVEGHIYIVVWRELLKRFGNKLMNRFEWMKIVTEKV